MVALSKTASCSIIIVASLVSVWMFQIGREGPSPTKALSAIHDVFVSNDTTSLSFTISVPHDAFSAITEKLKGSDTDYQEAKEKSRQAASEFMKIKNNQSLKYFSL